MTHSNSSNLIVTLFGTVHHAECPLKPGMTWAWEGRNNLSVDVACQECLPGGLPEKNQPHEFTAAEKAAFLELLNSERPGGDA